MKHNIIKIKNKGFTLIELMITVAIVGILAAVALPAYQDYTIRSQVTEGMSLTSGQKSSIAEYYSNHGSFPTAAQLGFSGATGKYVSATNIGTNGTIISTFGAESNANLAGKTFTLRPTIEAAGNLSWNCVSDAEQKYLPTSCAFQAGNPTNPGASHAGAANLSPEIIAKYPELADALDKYQHVENTLGKQAADYNDILYAKLDEQRPFLNIIRPLESEIERHEMNGRTQQAANARQALLTNTQYQNAKTQLAASEAAFNNKFPNFEQELDAIDQRLMDARGVATDKLFEIISYKGYNMEDLSRDFPGYF